MDLVDLMHTEVFDTMPSRFDVYLSGYIGDAVAGSSLYAVNSAEDLVRAMPYYGGALGLSYADALATAETMIAATPGPARYALYEQKFPQSTSRVTAAARPHVTVRRPFVDYRFFDAVQRAPPNGVPITRSANSGSSLPIRSSSRAFQTSGPVFHPDRHVCDGT